MAFMALFYMAGLLLLSAPLNLTNANSEGDALYALRSAVKDPDSVLQSWDPTLVDPCTWFHITCDRHNRVTRLDLGNANLSGSLVPELGKLEHLQYLEMYMNDLRGAIPEELGGLKSLMSLDLYQNNLTGSIPASLSNLSNLKFLDYGNFLNRDANGKRTRRSNGGMNLQGRLSGNRLTGEIPRQLTQLRNLKILDLSSNDLCGTIPTSGSFSKFSEQSYTKNPRLAGPELVGFARYDAGGSCN